MAVPAAANGSPRRTRSQKSPKIVRQAPLPPLDNVFSWSPESRTKFVELIALRSLLPGDPTEGAKREPKSEPDSGWRILPSKVEEEVADYFAFLAAAEPGPEHVSAVCIEERNGGGIVFRLAMNEGVPQRVVDGVRELCVVLEKVATGGSKSHQVGNEDIWEKVLDLQVLKIAGELKKKSSRTSRSFQEALSRAGGGSIIASAVNFSGDSLPSTIRSSMTTGHVRDGEAYLEMMYTQYLDVINNEYQDPRELVRKLLDTCYLARKSRTFKKFMVNIHGRKQLVQTIEKLGRYKAAAFSLVTASRKHSEVFKNIDFETINPPLREPFSPPENPETGLATLAAELRGKSVDEAKEYLKSVTGLDNEKLLSKYEDLYLGRPSIHAEIQLVKYYEENPQTTTPKFIGSSKKACYLCHLFLEGHGQFSVSKFHSTLAPRWTLPSITFKSPGGVTSYTKIMEQISQNMEKNCRSALGLDTTTTSTVDVFPKSPVNTITDTEILLPQTIAKMNASISSLLPSVEFNGQKTSHTSVVRSPVHRIPRTPTSQTPVPKTPNRTRNQSQTPRAVSRTSSRKVSDVPTRDQSPYRIPLPGSVQSSRVPTPVGGVPVSSSLVAPPILPRYPTLDETKGGVLLASKDSSRKVYSVMAVTPASEIDEMVDAPAPAPSNISPRHPHPQPSRSNVDTTMSENMTVRTKESGRTRASSMEVIIPRKRTRSRDTPSPTSARPTKATIRSIDPATLNWGGRSSSTSPLDNVVRETRRLSRIKATDNKHSASPVRGSLNLTIERTAGNLLNETHPHLADAGVMETEYTIYLAGHYAEGLAIGDEVFSGKISTSRDRARMIQCKGFRLRSSLRPRGNEQDGRPLGSARAGPLKVREVSKTAEKMVLDIAFSDAVVRLEVFWDI